MHPEIRGNLIDRHTRFPAAGHPDYILAKLLWVRLRHSCILPGHPEGKPDQMSPIRAADPFG
ncbi:hypothetical protein RE2895_62010 (plasmid) [Rhodococcus erythropolis]|nr:hypothetical protein RE2895_62010 [Rhodococcus erythropolis]